MLNHIATLKKEQLEKSDLISVFTNGYKSETVMQEKRTGIEFEKLPVLNDSFKAAPYFQVKNFLESFKDEHWQGVFENDALLGLKSENAVISLEPGSQTEISFNPITNLLDSQKSLAVYNKKTAQIANKFGIKWLGYGIQPVSTYGSINIIPKKRYEYMTKYLPTVAKRPLVMMRETSGIQASFDYQNEQDAMTKFGFALKFSPIVSAMFANSPVRNGRLTKFKSNRAASWLDTDNDRCGLVSPKAFSEDFTFEDYVRILLDVPMIFIERKIDGKKVYASSSALITTTTAPGAPTLKATAGKKKATLSWNKQTGASGYVLYMATSKNGKYSKIATLKGNSKVSFTKTGLSKGKTCYFKVKAYKTLDGKTVYGDYSAVKSAKIK